MVAVNLQNVPCMCHCMVESNLRIKSDILVQRVLKKVCSDTNTAYTNELVHQFVNTAVLFSLSDICLANST